MKRSVLFIVMTVSLSTALPMGGYASKNTSLRNKSGLAGSADSSSPDMAVKTLTAANRAAGVVASQGGEIEAGTVKGLMTRNPNGGTSSGGSVVLEIQPKSGSGGSIRRAEVVG